MKIFSLLIVLVSSALFAETKFSFDVAIDKLNFQKPPKGVGKAGILNVTSANVLNNGIVFNVNNINHYFDSQIFLRPNFIGFTTQMGNYGFFLEENSVVKQVNQSELINAKLVMDDYQVNLSGQYLSVLNAETNLRLKNFLLYCQSDGFLPSPKRDIDSGEPPTADIIKNCLRFMTLNGAFIPGNPFAEIEFEGRKNNAKTYTQSQIKKIDLRKNVLGAELGTTKIVNNEDFIIDANEMKFECAKDEDLTEIDFEKIKKACLNRLKINPLRATLVDKREKSTFVLDVNNVQVKDEILYLGLTSGTLSDPASTTYVSNLLVNCRKEFDSDLLEITDVLRDCISYGRISIAEVKSDNKIDNKKDNTTKNLTITTDSGKAVIQAKIRFLGMDRKVTIYGSVALNEKEKQIAITVVDAKLPFGINSVKLLMYFLKKDLISKDISIDKNVITVKI